MISEFPILEDPNESDLEKYASDNEKRPEDSEIDPERTGTSHSDNNGESQNEENSNPASEEMLNSPHEEEIFTSPDLSQLRNKRYDESIKKISIPEPRRSSTNTSHSSLRNSRRVSLQDRLSVKKGVMIKRNKGKLSFLKTNDTINANTSSNSSFLNNIPRPLVQNLP